MTGVVSAVENSDLFLPWKIQIRWQARLALAASQRRDIEGRVGVTLLEMWVKIHVEKRRIRTYNLLVQGNRAFAAAPTVHGEKFKIIYNKVNPLTKFTSKAFLLV